MKTKKCELEGCNKAARRRFCSNRHKDKYHNRHNPRGRFAHLRDMGEPDDEHPAYGMGWDGHSY